MTHLIGCCPFLVVVIEVFHFLIQLYFPLTQLLRVLGKFALLGLLVVFIRYWFVLVVLILVRFLHFFV